MRAYNNIRLNLLKTYRSVSGSSIKKGTRRLTSDGGVYFIYRESDGRVYIGESNNIQRRMKQHFTTARPNQTIDWAIFNEGAEKFRCGVIKIENDRSRRLKLETKYVSLFNSFFNGYNSTIDGKRKNKFVHWLTKCQIRFVRKHLPKRRKQLTYRNKFKMIILGWLRKL